MAVILAVPCRPLRRHPCRGSGLGGAYLGTELVEETNVLLTRLDEDVLLDEYRLAR